MKTLLHSLMPDIYGVLFIGGLYVFMVWVLPKLRTGHISISDVTGPRHDSEH